MLRLSKYLSFPAHSLTNFSTLIICLIYFVLFFLTFCVINLFECLFASHLTRRRETTFFSGFGAEFIYFCFVSTFCCYKKWTSIISQLKFLPSSRETSIILRRRSRFAISLSHTQNNCVRLPPSDRQNCRHRRKERNENTRRTNRKLCFIYFSIFFPRLISVCAFFLGSSSQLFSYTNFNMRTH